MTGALDDDEIPFAYAAMDVFVNAGTAELQSLVTLEAMATGRPVVAVDAGALPHLVDHGGNGFLYRHGTPAELAGRLETLLTDPDLLRRAGRRSLEMVAAHTLDSTLDTFETLYADTSRAGIAARRATRPVAAPTGSSR
jgi:glycosyltransferase involved in cell wall biosynthesis